MKRGSRAFAPGRLLVLAVAALLIAGCITPLPPTPQDLEAKRFESVPDRAVIYLVRGQPDFTSDATTILLNDNMMGTTYPGTYFRWAVAPGRHRIAGFAGDSGAITLDTGAGRIYFIQQSVTRMFGWTRSNFHPVNETHGRALVVRSELLQSQ